MFASSIGARYLERDGYAIDLRQVPYEQIENCSKCEEYIIFLNVKLAFFCNFHVRSSMSLESISLYTFMHARHCAGDDNYVRTDDVLDFVERMHREGDIVHINIHPWLRIVIAKKIRKGERYHQRITGYMDFEKRLDHPDTLSAITDYNGTRDILDSYYEKAIYDNL
ncbi:hypothetical protein SlsnVgp047 [Spodoptera littoralis nucleopolyhedrovirus]|uniref:Uncharacterized protein n=1 Tax=Spodoptera littoralis nuclear polyhedrosis virus TaxID=10456 RepID=M1JSI1_NPVSL|nr:hypothetical protein SlsnVgp047 [Spodoptera littoralis nucleopolyhedrovirus]AGE89902.1 hypothetical protein SlsnVgp047 [Spodoptera littoralis nucleopolyhedrovirus]AYU75237.1 hypothetical protein [Spodoptera littoralis nucleopolyhedrovirus]